MPVVQGVAQGVGGALLDGARVEVRLVASTTSEAAGYIAASDREVLGRFTTTTAVDGTWSVTLDANSLITPTNTYYEVVVTPVGGKGVTYNITVPNGAGPYWVGDILTDPVAGLPGYEIDKLRLTGLFSARPAASEAGRIYTATWTGTTYRRRYYDTGTTWVALGDPPGTFNVLDYGADPTGVADSRAAIIATITAALANEVDTGRGQSFDMVAGVVEFPPGVYWCSASIVLSDLVVDTKARHLWMRGTGGHASTATFAKPGCALINFATTNASSGNVVGFVQRAVPTLGSTITVRWDNLAIFGAPAVTVNDDGSAENNVGGWFTGCAFRSFTAGTAPVVLNDGFWSYFEHCAFNAPDTSTPSLLLTAGVVSTNFLTWDIYVTRCVLGNGGVRFDIDGATSAAVGLNVVVDGTTTENFAGLPLLHVRNTHATDSVTCYPIKVSGGYHYDAAGFDNDLIRLETLGTGSLTVSGIFIDGGNVSALGHHVHTVGAGSVVLTRVLILGQAPSLQLDAPTGSGRGVMGQVAGSGWQYIAASSADNAYALETKVTGEAQPRARITADGFLRRGLGAATPDVIFAVGAGSPNGVVSAAVGSIYQRTDGGAGTSMYVKETGTGNTGWVAK